MEEPVYFFTFRDWFFVPEEKTVRGELVHPWNGEEASAVIQIKELIRIGEQAWVLQEGHKTALRLGPTGGREGKLNEMSELFA